MKDQLALTNDDGKKAAAIRLKAARLSISMSQEVLAGHAGIKKTAVNNIENGLSFPARPLMSYLFRQHRIDYNFLINGSYSQLPADVQDRLFEQLEIVNHHSADRATPVDVSNQDKPGLIAETKPTTFHYAFSSALSATGQSVSEISKRSGVSADQLNKVRQRPGSRTNVEDARAVANAFGCTLSEFLKEKPQRR